MKITIGIKREGIEEAAYNFVAINHQCTPICLSVSCLPPQNPTNIGLVGDFVIILGKVAAEAE